MVMVIVSEVFVRLLNTSMNINMVGALSVSSMPKQNLPVSCEISSKYLEIRRFSCATSRHVIGYLPWQMGSGGELCTWMNFTFASVSAHSSIAWLKPFSPP